MWKCSECEERNEERDQFCACCGARRPQPRSSGNIQQRNTKTIPAQKPEKRGKALLAGAGIVLAVAAAAAIIILVGHTKTSAPVVNNVLRATEVQTAGSSLNQSMTSLNYQARGVPSEADLIAIDSQIEHPKDNEYFSDYIYAVVKAPGGHSVYGYGSADHMGNKYTVLDGEEVIAIAERKGYACCIIPSQMKARWINEDYLLIGGVESPKPDRPGEWDLLDIRSGIEYPKSTEYFTEYHYAVVKAPGGHSVFGFGSADHLGSSYTVLDGELVVGLAERKGYTCCIVLSQNRARWINSSYLVPVSATETASMPQTQPGMTPEVYTAYYNNDPVYIVNLAECNAEKVMRVLGAEVDSGNIITTGSEFPFFKLSNPIRDCIYFSVPIVVTAMDQYDNSGVEWSAVFHYADSDDWYIYKEFYYVDGQADEASMYNPDAVTLNGVTVIPTNAPDGYGAFQIGADFTCAVVGFKDLQSAESFLRQF